MRFTYTSADLAVNIAQGLTVLVVLFVLLPSFLAVEAALHRAADGPAGAANAGRTLLAAGGALLLSVAVAAATLWVCWGGGAPVAEVDGVARWVAPPGFYGLFALLGGAATCARVASRISRVDRTIADLTATART